jgi:hypothetical protein
MKISEVLHKAADEHLCHDYDSYYAFSGYNSIDKMKFSCSAISDVVGDNDELYERVRVGLENMGCPTNSFCAFTAMGYKDRYDIETQGARYLWLKFAALVAEEQGV